MWGNSQGGGTRPPPCTHPRAAHTPRGLCFLCDGNLPCKGRWKTSVSAPALPRRPVSGPFFPHCHRERPQGAWRSYTYGEPFHTEITTSACGLLVMTLCHTPSVPLCLCGFLSPLPFSASSAAASTSLSTSPRETMPLQCENLALCLHLSPFTRIPPRDPSAHGSSSRRNRGSSLPAASQRAERGAP